MEYYGEMATSRMCFVHVLAYRTQTIETALVVMAYVVEIRIVYLCHIESSLSKA